MKKAENETDKEELRKKAEAFLRKNPSAIKEMPPGDIQALVECLYVHEVELETQNEELRRSQRELEMARDRYSDLYEFAPVGYCTISDKGIILAANLTIATMLGVERNVMIGQPFSAFIDMDDQGIFYHNRRKLIETRNKLTCELRLVGHDGTPIDGHLECIVCEDDETNAMQIRVAITNITGRKQAEDMLRDSEERFRMLYDNAPLGYQSLDENGHFLEVNQTWLDSLGYSRDEVVGKSFGDFLHPDWVGHFKENFPRFKTMGEVLGVEFEMVKKDGSHVLMSINGSIRRDEKGQFVQTHCYLHDITERRRIEEEREALESQLQQAQKMEAIGTLSGGIAHDFNNILSVIVGNTELALMDLPEGNRAHGNLQAIQKASMRARDMVMQILAFSRQTAAAFKPLTLGPVVEESLKMLRSSLPSTIEIRQDITADTEPVRGDATQINQVLLNLCTNAAHAMKEQGGVLKVSLEKILIDEDGIKDYPDQADYPNQADYPHPAPGGYMRLTVTDTGTGIEPEVMEKIFDPYFTTKQVGEGSGMGLSVLLGIVKSHGGAVRADSEVGVGTTFEVIFPIAAEEPEMEMVSKDALPRGGENILFVDDEPSILEIYQAILERLGYHVTTQRSSSEALEVFRAQPDKYDLIITDQTMPQLTGQMLAKEMMAIRPDIPIILCTGHSDLVNDAKAKAMGIRAFSMKPVVIDDIARTIRKVLGDPAFPE